MTFLIMTQSIAVMFLAWFFWFILPRINSYILKHEILKSRGLFIEPVEGMALTALGFCSLPWAAPCCSSRRLHDSISTRSALSQCTSAES